MKKLSTLWFGSFSIVVMILAWNYQPRELARVWLRFDNEKQLKKATS